MNPGEMLFLGLTSIASFPMKREQAERAIKRHC